MPKKPWTKGQKIAVAVAWIFLGIVLLIIYLPSSESASSEAEISYSIVSEEPYEKPGKAQWIIRAVVPENASNEQIEQVLKKLYKEYRNKKHSNWKYHDKPTVLGIYVYHKEEYTKDPDKQGWWRGMLLKTPNSDVEISFQSTRLIQTFEGE